MFVLHFSSLSAVSAGQVITWRLSYIANITSTKANKEEKKKKKTSRILSPKRVGFSPWLIW